MFVEIGNVYKFGVPKSLSRFSILTHVVVVFESGEEGMALSERGHGLRECGIVFGLGQEFPRSPLLHDAEKFDLVVSLHD